MSEEDKDIDVDSDDQSESQQDQFTEVTTVGYGKKLVNSLVGILFGVLMFLGSFVVIYLNEGRIDYASLAKKAVPIEADKANTDASLKGKLVAAFGRLDSDESIGDGLFLKPDHYIALKRKVEMYAWKEESETESQKNMGGSETKKTTYTYSKEWTDNPADSRHFKHPKGHTNPQKSFDSQEVKVKNAKLGVYALDTQKLRLPGYQAVALTDSNLNLSEGAQRKDGQYIYVSKTSEGSFDKPHVGDVRISYSGFNPGAQGTVFGQIKEGSIFPDYDEYTEKLYRFFNGTKENAMTTLHSEYQMWLWLLRLGGFLLMWIGLMLFFGPISTLMDIVPMLGGLTKGIIAFVTFFIALSISIVTIIVSAILHSIVALIVSTLIVLALVFAYLKYHKSRKILTQPQPA
jgi:hypothetical protein